MGGRAFLLALLVATAAWAGDEGETVDPSRRAWDLYGEEKYAQALEIFLELARKGDFEAMTQVGVMYSDGEGVEVDEKAALLWWQRAYKGKDVSAMENLGYAYLMGLGVEIDAKVAQKYLREAAEKKSGYAMYLLGYMYLYGDGVDEDHERGALWIRKSAAAGSVSGMSELGQILFHGRGVERDYRKALQWLFRAVEDDEDAEAFRFLGRMHRDGLGTKRNAPEALLWYERAVKLGDSEAKMELADLLALGRGIERDFKRAHQLYKEALDDLVDGARIGLGRLYENGWGVKKNLVQAQAYFMSAGLEGEAEGYYRAALAAYDGLSGKPQRRHAAQLFAEGLQTCDDATAQHGIRAALVFLALGNKKLAEHALGPLLQGVAFSEWEGAASSYLRDKIDAEALLKKAKGAEQRAQGHFLVGSRLLFAGKKEDATKHLEAAVACKAYRSDAHRSAKLELARLRAAAAKK